MVVFRKSADKGAKPRKGPQAPSDSPGVSEEYEMATKVVEMFPTEAALAFQPSILPSLHGMHHHTASANSDLLEIPSVSHR